MEKFTVKPFDFHIWHYTVLTLLDKLLNMHIANIVWCFGSIWTTLGAEEEKVQYQWPRHWESGEKQVVDSFIADVGKPIYSLPISHWQPDTLLAVLSLSHRSPPFWWSCITNKQVQDTKFVQKEVTSTHAYTHYPEQGSCNFIRLAGWAPPITSHENMVWT